MKQPSLDLKMVFDVLPANYLLLLPNSPDFTIVGCSQLYAHSTGTEKDFILGKKLFEVFPDNPNDKDIEGVKNLTNSLNKVLASKAIDVMKLTHHDIPGTTGDFMEKFWNPMNIPVLDEAGNIAYIVHCVEDTTEKLSKIRGENVSRGIADEQQRRFRNIILRAPLAVAILRGPLFIIEAINEKMCIHWGRPMKDLLNKPLYAAIPESRTDEFETMLRNIFLTGERFTSRSGNVILNRKGNEERVFVDFVCEPLFDRFDAVESILVMAYETSVEVPEK